MAHGNPARTSYLRIRRWVDRDLATQWRPTSIFAPLFLALFALVGARALGGAAVVGGWVVVIPLGLAWASFVLWRVARLYKAAAIIGDRAFDQTGKYQLSAEYHGSESITASSRRKRALQQRRRT